MTRIKWEEGEKDEKMMTDTLNISLSFQTLRHPFILQEDLNSRMNDLNWTKKKESKIESSWQADHKSMPA